jgi:hypothetical protein
MDLEDELIVSLGASVEAESLLLQEFVEGGREIGQSPTDGQIAPPAEAFMIENAHPCRRSVHGSPFTVNRLKAEAIESFAIHASCSKGWRFASFRL